MSLVTVTSPLSAINPRVWWEGPTLCARTALILQLLCLFFWSKEIRVNPRAKTVSIQRRYLWFLRHRRAIHFNDISHLDYQYSSLMTGWNWMGQETDALESYTVALVLESREEVTLMRFRGEGSRHTGLGGVLLGDSLIDVEGDQQARSLNFVDALRDVTGKGLSKPRGTFLKPPPPRDH
jgi:hypothetical protein